MRHFKLFIACMLMVVLSIGQVWADNAAVGATLWAENFAHFGTNTPSAAGTGSGTTIFGGATITYAQSSANTKGYNEALAGGTAPELLLAKSNTTWTISGIPTGGATEMALSFKSNKTTFAVTTSTGDLSISGSAKAWTITVDEDKDTPATFDLVIKNTGSQNARIDDVVLTVVTAAEGGGTPIPTLSVSPAVIDFGSVEVGASVPSETVEVTFANLTGSVTYSGLSGAFSASGSVSATGDEITIAANTATAGDYSQTLTVQSAADELSKTVTVKMKVVAPLTPIAGGVVDELIVSDFGVTSGSYTAFTDKQASNEGHSDAVYAGKVARNGNSTQYNIQMNTIGTSTAAGREIATSTSGGYAKRVQAIWATQSTNTANRKLTVYGSESAYTGSETVATGTKLGDLTYTSGDTYAYLDIDGDYPYIQIVASGAIYMDQINVTWVSSAAAVAKPTISGDENFVGATTVTITHADADHIYYTTNGNDPTTSSTEYTDPFSLTNTATVKAIAVKGSDESAVAEKTFTKIATKTVAEAIAAIPNQDDVVNDQYVAGIVCTEGTSVNASGQMTYYISDDGLEGTRLQIYLGKNLNNTAFSAVSDLAIGDRVVVFGQLKNYKGTKEMNSGNYLVSKQDPAVATPVFTPNGGGFMGETDVTITCATASNAIYYTLDETTPSKSSTLYEGAIHLTETKTITAIAYVGDEHSIVVAKTFTYTSPMTVAEALTALDSENPINNATVTGIISTAPSSNPSSGKLTYYISDDGTTASELEVFNGFGLNGAAFSAKTDLQVGDQVTVFGNLKIYSGSSGDVKEFDTGSRLLAFNRPTVAVTGVQLEATASVKVGKTVALTAEVQPGNATNKTIVWSVQSGSSYASVDENGVVTGVTEGTAVVRAASDEDASIYAECTVTVSEAITFDNAGYEWQPATSLEAGKYYILGNEANEKVANRTITSGYLNTEAAAFVDGAIAYNGFGSSADKTADVSDAAVFQLGGNSTDGWTLTEVLGDATGLLGGVGTANATWGTGTTTWPISFDADNKVVVGSYPNDYRFLYNVNNPRFKPYNSATSSSMVLPQLYVWAEKTNKLKYDANGGSNAPSAQPAVAGKATVTDAKPTAPENKVFDRWNTTATGDGVDKAAGDEIDLSAGDVTLFAIWRDPATFSIAYDANGGTVIDGKTAIDPENITEGTQYTVKVNVYEKEGKVFTGWKAGETVYNAGDKLYPAASMTFVAQWSDPNISDFILVTDLSQLQDGDKVYIVAAASNNAMGAQNNKIRNRVEISKTADKSRVIIAGDEPVEFTLGKVGNNYTFNDGTGYLYASSSGSNDIGTEENLDADGNGEWSVSFDVEGNMLIEAQGNNTRKQLKYNSGSPRFSCYANGQQHVVLYKKANYVREMNPGRYGTICVPNSGTIFGAILYEVAYYDAGLQKIFFDEVLNGLLEAGKPYIFQEDGTVSKLGIVFSGTENKAVGEYKNNGLVGYIGADAEAWTQVPDDEDCYIIQNNQYRQVLAGADARIKSNRAYVRMSEVPTTASPIQPNRRRISMSGQGGQVATGVENGELLNGANGVQKVLINGELFILQGEKMYNASGVRVK